MFINRINSDFSSYFSAHADFNINKKREDHNFI